MICGLYRVRCDQVQDPRLSGTSHVPGSMCRHLRLCRSALDAQKRRAGHVVTKRRLKSGKPTTSSIVQWLSTVCSALLPVLHGSEVQHAHVFMQRCVRIAILHVVLSFVGCGFSHGRGLDLIHATPWRRPTLTSTPPAPPRFCYWTQFICAACHSQVHQIHESRAQTRHDCAQPASLSA